MIGSLYSPQLGSGKIFEHKGASSKADLLRRGFVYAFIPLPSKPRLYLHPFFLARFEEHSFHRGRTTGAESALQSCGAERRRGEMKKKRARIESEGRGTLMHARLAACVEAARALIFNKARRICTGAVVACSRVACGACSDVLPRCA